MNVDLPVMNIEKALLCFPVFLLLTDITLCFTVSLKAPSYHNIVPVLM